MTEISEHILLLTNIKIKNLPNNKKIFLIKLQKLAKTLKLLISAIGRQAVKK